MTNILKLNPQYYRWVVRPGEEWSEKNTGLARLNWEIPLEQIGLVLVDVWNTQHYLPETREREQVIVQNAIGPLVDQCRDHGLSVIHAPASNVTPKHKDRLYCAKKTISPSSWPPQDFRSTTGKFAHYARPIEDLEQECQYDRKLVDIHERVYPQGTDVVIETGEDLHAFCQERGILFLLYAGFYTNMCLLRRCYSIYEMMARGYAVVTLRDCTVAMESGETGPGLGQTQSTLLTLEMNGGYTADSKQFTFL